MPSKTVAKITLAELREISDDEDYDWKEEVLPNLDEVMENVGLQINVKEVCSLGLVITLGTPKKRLDMIRKGEVKQ